MKDDRIRNLTLDALFIAMVAVMTMVIKIPTYTGYIHLGDSMIFLVAVFFGRKKGALAGGVGSMFADILSGYMNWAPYTLVIKALMGFIVGAISNYDGEKFLGVKNVLGVLAGGAFMVFGYFMANTIMSGLMSGTASVFPNIVQAAGGMIIYCVIGYGVHRSGMMKSLKNSAKH